jgi:hypothetical protein
VGIHDVCGDDGARVPLAERAGDMAAAVHVEVRTVVISGVLARDMRMRVVTLPDRRTTPPSTPIEWMLKVDLEDLLYPSAITHGTVGAFYRLLKRSGLDTGLVLRRTSIDGGLVTANEFAVLKALFHTGVRVFTLVALTDVVTALATYGATMASRALLKALGMPPPDDWDEEEVEVDAESEEEEGVVTVRAAMAMVARRTTKKRRRK